MILAYNSGEELLRCVESVLRTVPLWARILLLDNGSTDDAPERALQLGSGIMLQKMGSNLGFAAAYNRGIRAVHEEFVILLNPDTVIDHPGWVEDLVAVAERDPRLAEVAAKLVFASHPGRINSVGGMVYWWTGPVDIGFGAVDDGRYGYGFEPFCGSGGAMLVRRSAFLEVGGFDDATFLYAEDVDLGWRLRLRGWKVGFAPNAVVQHALSTKLGGWSALKMYFVHRNFLRMMLRNYSGWTLIWALPMYALWTGVKTLGVVIIGRSPQMASAPLRAVGWNILVLRDTLSGRRSVQATRMISDSEIRKRMGPRGFESSTSILRRRMIALGHLEETEG